MLRSAGRPWPVLSEDPVLDYMVMEAVKLKVDQEDEEARKKAEKEAERRKFKRDTSTLDQYR